MPTINMQYAKKLCTASEFNLVQLSFNASKEQNSERINKAISQSRRLRDKYKDLSQRQKVRIKNKNAVGKSLPVNDHKRTDDKVDLFSQTLQRLTASSKSSVKQSQTDKRLSSKAPAKDTSLFLEKKKMGSSQKKNATKAKASNKKSLANQKSATITRSNAKAIHGHIGARTSRKQGKRDSR